MENGVEVYRKSEVIRGQDAGKGDARRPGDAEKFRENYDAINWGKRVPRRCCEGRRRKL